MAKPLFKRYRNSIFYTILFVFFYIARFLPRKIGLVLFSWIGRFIFLFPTKDKKRTIRNLSLIFSDTWSDKQIRRTASNVYLNLGKNLFDALYLSKCSNKKFNAIVKHDDLSLMQKAYNQGKGLIAIASHSGCFEINIHIIARKGFRCLTVGQVMFDKRVDRLIVAMRQRKNISYIHRDKSSRNIIKFIKEGGTLGVLIDQDTNIDGVFAHFLGLPAYTPSGPIRLAMRYNIPVFMAYSTRQKDNTHYLHLRGPIKLENTGDFNRDLVINIEKVNNFFSKGILQYPDQWVWMHRRWKKKPNDERYRDIPNIENFDLKIESG